MTRDNGSEQWSAPRPTCHLNRRRADRWTHALTYSASARCCTKCCPAARRLKRVGRPDWSSAPCCGTTRRPCGTTTAARADCQNVVSRNNRPSAFRRWANCGGCYEEAAAASATLVEEPRAIDRRPAVQQHERQCRKSGISVTVSPKRSSMCSPKSRVSRSPATHRPFSSGARGSRIRRNRADDSMSGHILEGSVRDRAQP